MSPTESDAAGKARGGDGVTHVLGLQVPLVTLEKETAGLAQHAQSSRGAALVTRSRFLLSWVLPLALHGSCLSSCSRGDGFLWLLAATLVQVLLALMC